MARTQTRLFSFDVMDSVETLSFNTKKVDTDTLLTAFGGKLYKSTDIVQLTSEKDIAYTSNTFAAVVKRCPALYHNKMMLKDHYEVECFHCCDFSHISDQICDAESRSTLLSLLWRTVSHRKRSSSIYRAVKGCFSEEQQGIL